MFSQFSTNLHSFSLPNQFPNLRMFHYLIIHLKLTYWIYGAGQTLISSHMMLFKVLDQVHFLVKYWIYDY